MKTNKIIYLVEGECEKKIIQTLNKKPYEFFKSGKIAVFNIINEKLTRLKMKELIRFFDTLIFIYDTDVSNIYTLEYNLDVLKKCGLNNFVLIMSNKNFEDEILRSTSLKNINEMFNTKSLSEFKSNFINCRNLVNKLQRIHFDPNKLWTGNEIIEPFKNYIEYFDKSKIKTKK